MKMKYLRLMVIIIIFLVGCTTAPTKDITVDANAASNINFSGYKSYTWLATAQIINDPYGQWEPPNFDADAEIKYLIDSEFRKRGMSEDSVNPDLIVAFAAGIDMDALGLKVDPETKMDTLINVPKGGLIVVLVDRASESVVWLGTATAELLEKTDSQTAKARLAYAVKQLFKKLPR